MGLLPEDVFYTEGWLVFPKQTVMRLGNLHQLPEVALSLAKGPSFFLGRLVGEVANADKDFSKKSKSCTISK